MAGWDDTRFFTGLTESASTQAEKTFVDKVLARRNIQKIEDLLKKDEWTRADLSRLLYLLVSDEIKLLYFRDWDRYTLGKYFVWVREIVRLGELYYDIEEKIKERTKKLLQQKKAEKRATEIYQKRFRILKRIEKQLLGSIRFATDIFLYLARSSLSLFGTAFDTLLKTRVEYEYRYPHIGEYVPELENYIKRGG